MYFVKKFDFMKKWCLLMLLSLFFWACDDGDIITTNLDFPEGNLQFCGGPGGYLFYKINDAGTESISVLASNSEQLFTETGTITISLNASSNIALYRIFDGTVDDSYFCNEVPPTSPLVNTEYIANSGTLEINTDTTLDDNDLLEAEDEADLDTDNDGIPNFYDFDDDGDNVPTILELDTENADGDNNPFTNPRDTDGDTIPDYLDDDDDGDTILTRYEDADGDLDPTNDIDDPSVGANYLNPAVTNTNKLDSYREHTYTLSSDAQVLLRNFILINGEEEINREFLDLGELLSIFTGTVLVTPEFVKQ